MSTVSTLSTHSNFTEPLSTVDHLWHSFMQVKVLWIYDAYSLDENSGLEIILKTGKIGAYLSEVKNG